MKYTSVSTVFRYAKLLVKYFERYRITFHPFKLELEAKEQYIRSFYYYFYWHSTRTGGWPFKFSKEKIENYLLKFERIYHIQLDPLQKRVFSYWLAVILERSSFASIIVDKTDQQVIKKDPFFLLIGQWLEAIEIPLSEDEQYFLYQVIYSFGVIDGNPTYENSYAKSHEISDSLCYRTLVALENAVKKEFDFRLDTDDQELVFNFVAFHERSRFFFGNTDLFFNRSYAKEIKAENPRIYKRIKQLQKTVRKYAEKEVLQVIDNWEQLFLNYYYILDYYDLLLSAMDPIKILIQDDLHHTHRLWLMNKIHRLFGHSYLLAFYDYQTAITEVDLVISNYYLDTQDIPLLLMKNLPTERNWRQLEELLYRIAQEK